MLLNFGILIGHHLAVKEISMKFEVIAEIQQDFVRVSHENIYILISIALNQRCSLALNIKQYKHFNKTSIHIIEDHRSVKSFTEGKHH